MFSYRPALFLLGRLLLVLVMTAPVIAVAQDEPTEPKSDDPPAAVDSPATDSPTTETGEKEESEPDAKESDAPETTDSKETDSEETDPPAEPEEEKPEPKTTDPEDADKPADSEKAPEPAEPKETGVPADTPSKPKVSAAEAKALYAQRLDEWKDVLRQLRDIRVEYNLAETPAIAAKLKEQWDVKLAEGRKMIDPIAAAAIDAYQAAPNEDRELNAFLLKMLADQVSHDRYEEAYQLGQILLANEAGGMDLHSLAGVAAFNTNHFDQAEEYLNKGKEVGALSEAGSNSEALVTEYKRLWEKESKLRAAEAEADDLPRVLMKTSEGDVTIELLENEAPNAVANFISLVEKGFYDGVSFHRVLPGFMAQGGDPDGTGMGGPGYNIPCECHQDNARMHFRGSLSMAHAGRDTGGSQFFLTFIPTAHLNGQHTVFGRVIDGMDVLSKLHRRDPSGAPPLPEPSTIESAKVLRKRDHKYEPKKVE